MLFFLCFTGLIKHQLVFHFCKLAPRDWKSPVSNSELRWNSNPTQRSQLSGFSSSPLEIQQIKRLSHTHESENVFLVVAEHILSPITVKDKNIQGPSLVCKTTHHIFHHVSFPIANGGLKNMQEITALNNLVLLNSDSFDLVPGPWDEHGWGMIEMHGGACSWLLTLLRRPTSQ